MLEENNYIQFKNLNNNDVTNIYTKKPFNFNGNKIEKHILEYQYKEIQKILNYNINKIIKPIQTFVLNVTIISLILIEVIKKMVEI